MGVSFVGIDEVYQDVAGDPVGGRILNFSTRDNAPIVL
jgi:hypothetical protein